jgi:hypothetical protein
VVISGGFESVLGTSAWRMQWGALDANRIGARGCLVQRVDLGQLGDAECSDESPRLRRFP